MDSEPFALLVRWGLDKTHACPFLNPPLLHMPHFLASSSARAAARRLKCRTLTPAGGIGNVTIVSAYHPPVMLIPSPTSSEALGRPHRAPNFCIRHGAAAGGGGDEWPRRGNRHHRRSVSRGGRHIPDATRCLGRPAEPSSHADAFPNLIQPSLQPFVPAHRTTACDDWLTHGPMMHARPARGLLG